MARKTLDKETKWQIGEAYYFQFLEYLGHKYEINNQVRTPTTGDLEEFFAAKTHEELVPLMMREYLSNFKV